VLEGKMTAETVELVSKAVTNAISGLSGMTGKQFRVFSFDLKKVKVKEVPYEFGGPEALIVGVYLKIKDKNGHIFVGYKPEIAAELVGMALGQEPNSTLDLSELEQSVLGEIGNLVGSFFLNTLAEGIGMSLLPSPPAVIIDMAGAVLDTPLSHILEHEEETLILTTNFGTQDKQINGKFLIAPMPALEQR
jgi:chemotaxis protein CheC